MLRPLAIASVLLVLVLAAGCGGSGATKEDFRQDVLAARNDTDAGARPDRPGNVTEDLLARMRIAAVEVRGASTDVREAGAPKELQAERDALADRLLALSDEIVGTSPDAQAFPDQAASTRALNFEQWNAVQRELTKLRRLGVNVPPLETHKPEPQRQ